MNRRLELYWMIMAFIVLCLTGCGLSSDRMPSKKILDNPPYAGLTDSIKRFPNDALLYLHRAALLSQNNKHEIATADYKAAWELKPDENTALEYISNLLMVDKVKEAVALLKKCAQQYPQNPEFSRRLSEVYVETGRSKRDWQ